MPSISHLCLLLALMSSPGLAQEVGQDEEGGIWNGRKHALDEDLREFERRRRDGTSSPPAPESPKPSPELGKPPVVYDEKKALPVTGAAKTPEEEWLEIDAAHAAPTSDHAKAPNEEPPKSGGKPPKGRAPGGVKTPAGKGRIDKSSPPPIDRENPLSVNSVLPEAPKRHPLAPAQTPQKASGVLSPSDRLPASPKGPPSKKDSGPPAIPQIGQDGVPDFEPPPVEEWASPGAAIDDDRLGFSSLRSRSTHVKYRVIADAYGGGWSQSTAVGSASVGVRIDDWIIGGAVERAQWLDTRTNVGKFTETYMADLCASMTFELSWLAIQPCYRYGVGMGVFKQRNALNEIETITRDRASFKVYGRLITLVPLGDGNRLAIEGTSGYSEDPFLYGPFVQAWVRTSLFGFSIGYENYAGQRQAGLVGYAFGMLEVPNTHVAVP